MLPPLLLFSIFWLVKRSNKDLHLYIAVLSDS